MKSYLNVLLAFSVLTGSISVLSGCGSTKAANAADSHIPTVKAIVVSGEGAPGASGKIAPAQTTLIYAKNPGRVLAVNVEQGSKVKKGDVLVQLETDDLTQQLSQAQANYEAAQAKLNDVLNGARPQDVKAAEGAVSQARAGVDSADAAAEQAKAAYELVHNTSNQVRNRYDEGNANKNDLDNAATNEEKAKASCDQAAAGQASAKAALSSSQAKLDLLKAGATGESIAALRAQVNQAQAALELVKHALEAASIKSPTDGIVVKRTIEPGEMAFTMMPTGTELMTIVNMDSVNVEASVPENLISQVKEGASVTVTLPSIPGKTFEGAVSFVSPVSDQNNNTFPIKVTVKNPDGALRAGAIANVSFNDGGQSRIEMPKSALVNANNGFAVYKLDGEIVHKMIVQTEEKNQDWVYVIGISTLKANDRIVINPTDKLADGSKVHAE